VREEREAIPIIQFLKKEERLGIRAALCFVVEGERGGGDNKYNPLYNGRGEGRKVGMGRESRADPYSEEKKERRRIFYHFQLGGGRKHTKKRGKNLNHSLCIH